MTKAHDRTRPNGRAVLGDERVLADRISVVQRIAERLTDVVDLADLCQAVTSELRSGLGVTALVMVTIAEDGSGLTPLVVEGVGGETRSRLSRRASIRRAHG